MDKRKNNGGKRKGAGRKPKEQNLKLTETMRNVLEDEELITILAKKVREEDMKAIQLWTSYLYGMPTQRVENAEVKEIKPTQYRIVKKDD